MNENTIEKALNQIIPVEMMPFSKELSRFLLSIIRKEVDSEQAAKLIQGNDDLLQVIKRISGDSIALSDTVITFGANNQAGDITIRDVIRGGVVNLHLNLPSLAVDRMSSEFSKKTSDNELELPLSMLFEFIHEIRESMYWLYNQVPASETVPYFFRVHNIFRNHMLFLIGDIIELKFLIAFVSETIALDPLTRDFNKISTNRLRIAYEVIEKCFEQALAKQSQFIKDLEKMSYVELLDSLKTRAERFSEIKTLSSENKRLSDFLVLLLVYFDQLIPSNNLQDIPAIINDQLALILVQSINKTKVGLPSRADKSELARLKAFVEKANFY